MIEVLVFVAGWVRENFPEWAGRDIDFVLETESESVSREWLWDHIADVGDGRGWGFEDRRKWLTGPSRHKVTFAGPGLL